MKLDDNVARDMDTGNPPFLGDSVLVFKEDANYRVDVAKLERSEKIALYNKLAGDDLHIIARFSDAFIHSSRFIHIRKGEYVYVKAKAEPAPLSVPTSLI